MNGFFLLLLLNRAIKWILFELAQTVFLKYVYSHLKGQSLRQFHLNYTAYFHMY